MNRKISFVQKYQAASSRFARAILSSTLLMTPALVPTVAHSKTPSRNAYHCNTVAGASALLEMADQRFIIMGEIHGTEQTPALFADLVCLTAETGPVTVILEYPISQSDVITRFTQSQGSAADREYLLSSWIWNASFADGRSSQAMFRLLEHLREMRAKGMPVEVYTAQPDFDILPETQHYYELGMAARWTQIAALRPKSRILVLTGRAHASKLVDDDVPFPGAVSFLPSSAVVTLLPQLEGGATWNLHDKRPGVHALEGTPADRKDIWISPVSGSVAQATYSFGEVARPSPPLKTEVP